MSDGGSKKKEVGTWSRKSYAIFSFQDIYNYLTSWVLRQGCLYTTTYMLEFLVVYTLNLELLNNILTSNKLLKVIFKIIMLLIHIFLRCAMHLTNEPVYQ